MDTIIFLIGLLTAPYLFYVFLYGVTLVKRLLADNWNRKKGLTRYVQMSPDERMAAEARGIAGGPPAPAAPPRTAWLEPASPKEAEKIRQERVLQEGLRPTPQGKWEEAKSEEPPPVSKLP